MPLMEDARRKILEAVLSQATKAKTADGDACAQAGGCSFEAAALEYKACVELVRTHDMIILYPCCHNVMTC